jgi:uncharacterized protein (TIGR03435 family)
MDFRFLCAGLALAASLWGQGPAFEVASVKPSGPINPQAIMSGQTRIGMKVDAARVDIGNVSMADLIRIAYRVKAFQVSGPSWITTERYDIQAKLPEGGSPDQVPEMLQALLAERFHLKVHKDSKEQPVLALIVGKNGPKLKESPAETEAPPAPAAEESGKGFTINAGQGQVHISGNPMQGRGMSITGGQFGAMRMTMAKEGGMHMESDRMTMTALVEMLSRFSEKPVVDMTELKGTYQVALDVSMEELMNVARSAGVRIPPGAGAMGAPGGPAGAGVAPGGGDPGRLPGDAVGGSGASLFTSIQQLGLKLDPRKVPVELIVVDSADKTPTEN